MPNPDYMAICPFWKGEGKTSKGYTMTCELCKFRFSDNLARREIAYKYCAGDYKACMLYPVAEAAAMRAEKRKNGSM